MYIYIIIILYFWKNDLQTGKRPTNGCKMKILHCHPCLPEGSCTVGLFFLDAKNYNLNGR